MKMPSKTLLSCAVLLLSQPCLAGEPSIAAQLYGALPLVRDAHLSPDGDYLALVSGATGEEQFGIMTIAGKQARRIPITDGPPGSGESIRPSWIAWKGQSRLLAGALACQESEDGTPVVTTKGYTLSSAGAGSISPLYLERINGPNLPLQFRDRVVGFAPDDPNHVLIEARVTDSLYPDVEQVDVETGIGATLTPKRLGVTDWLADGTGKIRLSVAFPHKDLRRVISVRRKDDSEWLTLHEDRVGQDPAFVPIAFSRRDPAILFIGVEDESRHLTLREFDTSTMSLGKVVAADPQADVTPILRAGDLIGYRIGDQPIVYLDGLWNKTAGDLRKALPGAEVELVDSSEDGRRFLVLVTEGARPSTYYLLDKRDGRRFLDPIGAAYGDQVASHSAPVATVTYPAQDGTTISALITLPPGHATGPIPFVVLAHDGPAGHDDARFDYVAQFLASRGYGVFQPQFRGSTRSPAAAPASTASFTSLDSSQPLPPVANAASLSQVYNNGQGIIGFGFGLTGRKARAQVEASTTAFGRSAGSLDQFQRETSFAATVMALGPTLESAADPNFAGLSDGSAPAFTRAGLGQWGRSIQDDITDGTHWLIAQGYADPQRVCIAGSGFGGYAALMGVAKDLTLYRCAAAFAPVTDLQRLATEARAYLDSPYLMAYLRANGDLSEISPVEQAGKIDVPVLLVQGRRDCDIPAVQTEEMEHALSQPIEKVGNVDIETVPSRSAARPPDRPRRSVTTLYLDGADHALSRSSDRIAYLSALETFFAANLRPASQPGS